MKTKQNQPGQKVETPKASVELHAEFTHRFTPETERWIVRGKSGQERVAEKEVIAALLLAKRDRYADADVLKAARKSFRVLTPEKKQEWLAKATEVFRACRKEYCDVMNPLLKKASQDKRFKVERAQFFLTKSGIVHVAHRMTHRPVA